MKASILDNYAYQSIVQRIQVLTPNHKAEWGKMDVNQMIVHVTDQIRIAMNQKESEDISSFFARTVLKYFALRVSKMPKNVPTVKEADSEKGGTKPTNWEKDKATMLALLVEFRTRSEYMTLAPHPKFGKLTRSEWASLIYRHLAHHLGQFGV